MTSCSARIVRCVAGAFALACLGNFAPQAFANDPIALRAALETVSSSDLRAHVEVLADDALQGRDSGSPGGYAATKYLALLFEKYGLEPAGERETYLQVFGNEYRNVIGLLPGTDPELADEIIVIGAHYDHVGLGNPNNSYGPYGEVHNGADDNASGTATLVELVEALSDSGAGLRRPVLFCLWDAEEDGLLGSIHWLQNPTVAKEHVCFSINLDMVGRLRESEGLSLYGERTAKGLRAMVSRLNEENIRMKFDWELADDSDHHPFIESNIPTLMFHTGLHDQYHRPSDDIETLNYEGMQSVARLVGRVLSEVANADEPPIFREQAWQEGEEFRKSFEAPAPSAATRLGLALEPPAETAAESGEPASLLISVVEVGTPAEKAGLVAGQKILAVDGEAVDADEFWNRIYDAESSVILTVESAEGEIEKLTVALEGGPVRVGVSWRMDEGDSSIALVTRVAPMTRADRCGLRVGDRIYRAAGEPLVDNDQFRQLLLETHGDLELLIEREGVLETCTLELP